MDLFFAVTLLTAASATGASAQASPEACLAGWTQLAFDPQDFDRYPEVFRADSTVSLAQAGRYTGPADIEEYVRFAGTSSPYISGLDAEFSAGGIKGIDGDICIFNAYAINIYHLRGDLFGEDPPSVKTGIMFYYYYNVAENYIAGWSLYYPTPFLAYFFNLLDTPAVHDFICGAMDGCGLDVDSCQERLTGLPLFSDGDHVDGRDYGCRALHGVFAVNNTSHCAHLSFEPMEDPLGRVKCQESAGLQPEDLFDEDDLASFGEYCATIGVDPSLCYIDLSAPPGQCQINSDCSSVGKCTQHPHKCKCKANKCKKKKNDCKTKGEGMEWWGCREGKTCVAEDNEHGLSKKWGKCRSV